MSSGPGLGDRRDVMHSGLEERGTGNTLWEGRPQSPQASFPRDPQYGRGTLAEAPRTPAFTAGSFCCLLFLFSEAFTVF